jgi:hypothetical protein
MMDMIRINISGTEFLTRRSTILNIPGSTMAEALNTKSHYESSIGCYFFDRSPDYFATILKAHQKEELHIPDDVCGIEMVEELEYWKLPLTIVAQCCIGRIHDALRERDIAKAIKEEISYDCDKSLEILTRSAGWEIYRIRLWMFLQIPVYSKWAKVGGCFCRSLFIPNGQRWVGVSADYSKWATGMGNRPMS